MFQYHPKPNHDPKLDEEYLIQQAILDAQDLLADLEKDSFQKQLSLAPKETQEKVLNLQAETTEFLALLSPVEPPHYLKDQVVNKILSSNEIKLKNPLISNTIWKITALILLGCVISLSIINQKTHIMNKTLEQSMLGGESLAAITSSIGNQASVLIQDPNAQWHFFKPSKIDGPKGFLINDGDTKKSLIVLLNANPGAYKIKSIDKNYAILSSFDIILSNSIGGSIINLEDLNLINAEKLAVFDQAGSILSEIDL